jgi:GTPase SAR1 family protein
VFQISYRGKVVFCGQPEVGKTSLLARYVDGNFNEELVRKDIYEKGFKEI